MTDFLLKIFFKSFTVLIYFFRWLEKVIFYKHYNFSHHHYLRKKYKKRWRSISDQVMYHLDLEDVYYNGIVFFSKLYLKPIISNKNDVIEIDFSLIARCNKIDYVHPIKHGFYDDNVAVFTLTNIPLKELRIVNNRVFTSFDTYYFQINQIHIKKECVVKDIKSLEYNLMYFEELNGEFIKKWGRYWNLSLYKSAREEFKIAIAASFLEDPILLSNAIKMEFLQRVRVGIVRVLLRDKCLRFLFWSLLILNLAKVTINGELKSKYFSVEKFRRFFRLKYPSFYG